ELRTAISVGIGLFIALIGLVDAGIVRIPASQATPVELGVDGSLAGWPTLVFVIGLLAAIILYLRKVRGALLIAIIGATVLALIVEAIAQVGGSMNADGSPNATGWRLNVPALPDQWVTLPDFSLLGQFSLLGSWSKIGGVTVVLLVFSLLLADFFDTMGTMVAVGTEAKLLDEDGSPIGTRRILIVDSIAAAAGGAASVSSNTSYIESTAGVGDGARTGLASVVTGIAFLLATFLSPVVDIVPSEAATPALVVVGFLMMTQVLGIDWARAEVAVPAFLTIILMPFTYSITAGMGAGFIAFVVIQVFMGKGRRVHPLMWVTAVLFTVAVLRWRLQSAVGRQRRPAPFTSRSGAALRCGAQRPRGCWRVSSAGGDAQLRRWAVPGEGLGLEGDGDLGLEHHRHGLGVGRDEEHRVLPERGAQVAARVVLAHRRPVGQLHVDAGLIVAHGLELGPLQLHGQVHLPAAGPALAVVAPAQPGRDEPADHAAGDPLLLAGEALEGLLELLRAGDLHLV